MMNNAWIIDNLWEDIYPDINFNYSEKHFRRPTWFEEQRDIQFCRIGSKISDKELEKRISFYVKSLPEQEKQIVYLVYKEKMSYGEIAKTIGCYHGKVTDYIRKMHQILTNIQALNIYEYGIEEGCARNNCIKESLITKLKCNEYNFTVEEKRMLCIGSSDMKTGPKNALIRADIFSFAELLEKSDADLLAHRGIGKRHVQEIRDYTKHYLTEAYGVDIA